MTAINLTLMTAEELAEMPDDGKRYELIRGELSVNGPTFPLHGWIESGLNAEIRNYAIERRLGVVLTGDSGFTLHRDPDTVLAPDIAFYRAERWLSDAEQRTFTEVVPDLVVEVLSASERAKRISDKVAAYLEAGVQLVWLVDERRRQVTIHAADGSKQVLQRDDQLDGGAVLPGFRLRVSEIFRIPGLG